MTVNYGQKKVVVFSQVFFNPANHHGAVGIANLFGNHADRISPTQAQRARKKVGPVVQSLRRFDDAVLGMLRNRARCRRVIQRGGNRAGSKTEVIRDSF